MFNLCVGCAETHRGFPLFLALIHRDCLVSLSMNPVSGHRTDTITGRSTGSAYSIKKLLHQHTAARVRYSKVSKVSVTSDE